MEDESTDCKDYLCEYIYGSSRWSVKVKATSFSDAAARLKAIADGKVLGPIGAEIYVPDNEAAIAPMEWMMNRVSTPG